MVVIKPAGMACEMRADLRGESLMNRLAAAYPGRTPKLPHRIDRVTRGVVLVALSDEAVRYYNDQIRTRLWDKLYLGRTHQNPDRDPGQLLGRHKAFLKEVKGRARIVTSGGAPSFLDIVAIEEAPSHPDERHVLVRLLTGRYHQVRAMLQGLGLPLVGDPLYGNHADQRTASRTFYLEHMALRYRDFSSGALVTAYWQDDPARESLSDNMVRRIRDILLATSSALSSALS